MELSKSIEWPGFGSGPQMLRRDFCTQTKTGLWAMKFRSPNHYFCSQIRVRSFGIGIREGKKKKKKGAQRVLVSAKPNNIDLLCTVCSSRISFSPEKSGALIYKIRKIFPPHHRSGMVRKTERLPSSVDYLARCYLFHKFTNTQSDNYQTMHWFY